MGSKKNVLKTLLYSDIFDYPLKKEEIYLFLISNKKTSLKAIEKDLEKTKEINFKKGFYFLKGKEKLIVIRKKREKNSLIKLRKAKKIAKKLSLIPTIKFIGISGNLALKNSDKRDDIDFFIVSSRNTIWISRFLVVLVLRALGVYRKRGEEKVSNKICTNMFIDEENLAFSRKRKNLFTAHELIQLLPVIDKEHIYQKILFKNKWVLDYLPNSFSKIEFINTLFTKNENKKKNIFLSIFNTILKIPQVLYMQKHKTKEEISDKILAFHPFDHKDYVLETYGKKLQKYGL